jgi:tRNA A37 methylthiotransferase MiaB
VKEERKAELMEIQKDISLSINQKFIGQKMKVIIDGKEAAFT